MKITGYKKRVSFALKLLSGAFILLVFAASPERAIPAESATSAPQLIAEREKLRREEIDRRKQEEKPSTGPMEKRVIFTKTINKTGEIDRRIDVVICSDGYGANQMGPFSNDADRIAGQLLRTFPFSEYRNFINVHLVGVAWKDSLLELLRQGDEVIVQYGPKGEMTFLPVRGHVGFCLGEAPDADLGIFLAQAKPGEGYARPDIGVLLMARGDGITAAAARGLGVAFGKLREHGPADSCIMGGKGRNFCQACLAQMIRRICEIVPPIDAASPPEHVVSLSEGETQKFAIRANSTPSVRAEIEWFVDGVSRGNGSPDFAFSGAKFKAGEHEVMARVIMANRALSQDNGILEGSVFWKVTVTPGSPPKFDKLARPLTVNAGEELKSTLKAAPGNAGKPLTFKIDRGPEGLRIDAGTGEITWTPQKSQAGAHLAIVTADDGENKASIEVVIGVVDKEAQNNRMPVIEYVPIQDVGQGKLVEFQLKATDLDGNSVVFDLPDPPPGAAFDRETGKFRWGPDFAQAGDYELEFRAWDGVATDKYKVPVSVHDTFVGADDLKFVQSHRDAFAWVFYALHSQNADIRQQCVAMLRNEGAKSSVLELNRLLRDRDHKVAEAAGEALLAVVREKLAPEDSAYFTILLNDISRTAGQLARNETQLEKLKEIVTAVGEKTTDKKIKQAAEALSAGLDKITQ